MQDNGNESLLRAFFRKKWVVGVLIADIIILLVVILALIKNSNKSATVSFNIAPIDATISVNGDSSYVNDAQYSFDPGKYEIVISHDDLESKTINIDLQAHEATSITTFLHGQDGNLEFYEYKDNYMSFERLQKIASAFNNSTFDQDNSAEEFIKEFAWNYELYQTVLPYDYTEYDTGYDTRKIVKEVILQAGKDENCNKTICIEARMVLTNDEKFVDKLLKEKGFDKKYCEIKYEVL